jgi:Protein of unknown function (DUF1761)
MLLIFGFLLFLAVVSMVLLLPVLWGREIYNRYRGSRAVVCPETREQVAVSLDALHAAVTGLSEKTDLHVADCTRWPTRSNCGQECLPQALRTEPYTAGEVDLKTKRIYHLPVLLAAFASWYLGAVWHSHHLFRARWMTAVGLTPSELKQIVLWYSPHLLSVAACLLFAYGVAWLVALRGRRGLWQGILTAVFLWGAVILATLPGMAGVSRDLLTIEVGYTFLATIVVGALIGGLTRRRGEMGLAKVGDRPLL